MSSRVIQPVLLAGGSGTRLWPLSRQAFPKQFVELAGNKSLFQETLLRVHAPGFLAPQILGHTDHRFMIAEHCRSCGITPAAIVLEPESRDNAAAICVAALLARRNDPSRLLLLLPCDHVIQGTEEFRQTVLTGVPRAEAGDIVVFGVKPTSPHTGYGYIECGASFEAGTATPIPVTRFVEKPSLETAEKYVRGGRHLWNAGIFLFRADTILKAFEDFAPDILSAARLSVEGAKNDLDFLRLDVDAYARARKTSIDYAIIEKFRPLSCVPLETFWTDCGDWSAVHAMLPKDQAGNATYGNVSLQGVSKSLAYNDTKSMLVMLGLENAVAIVTADSILVASQDRVQELKGLVERFAKEGRPETVLHRKVHRPWGTYEGLIEEARFQVKRIVVKPGARISLQSHMHRAEHWIVVSGTIEVTCDGKTFLVSENQSAYIPVGAVHRIANPGKIPASLIEVQSGAYLGEDDIVRYEDAYGRAPANKK